MAQRNVSRSKQAKVPAYLTVRGFAVKHGLSVPTVYRHIQEGKLPSEEIYGRLVIAADQEPYRPKAVA